MGIILMPFIGTIAITKKIFYPLGSGLFLFALIGSFFWLIRRRRIEIPSQRVLWFIMVFVIFYFISGAVNLPSMFRSVWQGVQGIERYLLSMGLWSVEFISLLYMYNIYLSEKNARERISFFLLISFFLSAGCGVVEFISILGNNAATEVLSGIDSLYRGELFRQPFRIQSFASEPSQYSVYLVVIFPLLLFKLIKSKHILFYALSLVLFFVLLFATYSRTGYFIILIEFFGFCFFFRREIRWEKLCMFCLMLFLILGGGGNLVGDAIGGSERVVEMFATLLSNDIVFSNMSNMARFGATMAAMGIFQDHIFFGVGYDQFAFYAANYYPDWAYMSIEIVDWSTNYSGRAAWPPAFNYYVRLLAEVGFFGALAWIGVLWSVWREGWRALAVGIEYDYLKVYLIMFLGQAAILFNTSDISITNIFVAAVILAETRRLQQESFKKKEGLSDKCGITKR
ncbi:O-antigen ligase family protein [Selenomonas sp. CM52]|uniref:O-antigen ligase family protein n=1 Tax=Selenomonas sp. CM52 TaxID=936381 RepID=UPI0018DB55B6|nr:O-antigen ligase family protein [Selenomonas sp. CM52]